MEFNKAFSKRLKAVREQSGYTPNQVKEKTGYAVGRAEKGQTGMSISQLKQLCDLYGVSLTEFFGGIKTNTIL